MNNINDIEEFIEKFTEEIKTINYVFCDEELAEESSRARDKMIESVEDYLETFYKNEEQDVSEGLEKKSIDIL